MTLIYSSHGFHVGSLNNAMLRTKTVLFNGKTPLVANGKRYEADPGSSLYEVKLD